MTRLFGFVGVALCTSVAPALPLSIGKSVREIADRYLYLAMTQEVMIGFRHELQELFTWYSHSLPLFAQARFSVEVEPDHQAGVLTFHLGASDDIGAEFWKHLMSEIKKDVA